MKLPELKSLLFFIFYLITVSYAHGQVVVITDRNTGEPITEVGLFSPDKRISAITNFKGEADISNFPDTCLIHFQHPTYDPMVVVKKQINATAPISLTPRMIWMDEFVVSASKTKEVKRQVPFYINHIKASRPDFINAPTSADLLTLEGNVTVQKSQAGGGSPNLRGFEANRVLLVVDGIRMNNAIYRGGHLQNSITIDPLMLDNVEVIFGPSSVIYGSDAIGGVVHYTSRIPQYAGYQEKSGAQASIQMATATEGFKGHVSAEAAKGRWSSITGFTYSEYGDIKIGKYRPKTTNPPNWGQIDHWALRTAEGDSMVTNSDPNQLPKTGYNQYDLFHKSRVKLSDELECMVNLQFSTSSNIHRFDQLNDYKNDTLKYGDWYYGPQDRLLAAFQMDWNKSTAYFDHARAILSYQYINEDRHSRYFGDDIRLNQWEKLHAEALNIDMHKSIKPKVNLDYGFEVVLNQLASTSNNKNIETGLEAWAPTRYPNGGTRTGSFASYINLRSRLADNVQMNGGLRYSYQYSRSEFNNDSYIVSDPVVKINTGAPSYSLGFVLFPEKKWQVNTVFSSGFRAPNVDDYGKVRVKGDNITVPNGNLNPEYAYNLELGFTHRYKKLYEFNITGYRTLLTNAIVSTPSSINGNDSIDYNGKLYKVYSNNNMQKSEIYGVSGSLWVRLAKRVHTHATLNYSQGNIIDEDTQVAHIPPLFGRWNLNYEGSQFQAMVYVNYNGVKKIEDSHESTDNSDEATIDGWPSWYTININLKKELTDQLYIQAAVENIMDMHYKTFASGPSAVGRNFIVTLAGRF